MSYAISHSLINYLSRKKIKTADSVRHHKSLTAAYSVTFLLPFIPHKTNIKQNTNLVYRSCLFLTRSLELLAKLLHVTRTTLRANSTLPNKCLQLSCLSRWHSPEDATSALFWCYIFLLKIL